MLRKPDIYTTVNSSPLRGIQCPFLPTQVSHRDTAFLPSRHSSNILFHTPSACSKPAQPAHYTTQGRNLPPPSLGPVLIRKWEQQPGTGVIPACQFPPLLFSGNSYKEYPQQTPLSLQNTRSLLFTTFTIPSWGRGALSQEEGRSRRG